MTPGLAHLLADALVQSTASGHRLRGSSTLDEAESVLADLAAIEPDHDLRNAAARQDPGSTPLVGTAHTAATYPALLWNGERFERVGTAWPVRLAFLIRTVGEVPDRFAAAVDLGVALRSMWPPAPVSHPVAGLTADTVAAAACAAVAAGLDGADLECVAELAAGLMLITPADPRPELAGLYAGHALAVGWLALQLHRCGVLAAPGTAAEVLAAREAP